MSFYAIKKTRLSIAFSLVLFLSLFGGSPVAYASTVLGGDGGSIFSIRSAQANVSGIVNSLSVRVYCGLSALFFESCGIGDLAPVADDTQSEVKTPGLSIKKQSAENIRPIPAMVQKVVETVARPVGIDNVFKDFVNARIAEMASELRSEMSAQVTVVQTRTRSEGDSFLSRQIDRIYDDTNESLSDAIANLNDFSEEEVMAFVSNRVALGTEGYVLQATATGTIWVATSTLGITSSGSSQWQDSGLDIYFSTGSVGIGTSTVASKLTVSGGQITADYGSASAPSYSFISAPDTGMYASAGNLSFAVAGNQILELTETSITPVGVELSLDIDGSATAPAINWGSRISDSDTGIYSPASDTIGISTNGIARMLINSSGNVGIGTTTPGSALTVAGNGLFSGNITSTGQMFATASTSNSLPAFAIAGDSDTGFTYTNNSFRLIKDGTATFAIDTLIGFVAPFYRISGVSGTAANASYGHISSAGTGMFFPSIGSLSLTTAGTARMLIDSSGNVGIGTTTPGSALTVVGNGLFSGTVTSNIFALNGTSTITRQSNNALLIGDITGNARGVNALDFQMTRLVGDRVASGPSSMAIGRDNTTSGTSSVAVGNDNLLSASANYAFGRLNNISGNNSTAYGYSNTITAVNGDAYGSSNTVSGQNAVAFGSGNTSGSLQSIAIGIGNSVTSANFATAIGFGVINNIQSSVQIGPSNAAKITLLSNGHLAIGTTSAPARLSVIGTSTFSAPLFDVATSTGISVLHVAASGNLGIGTTTPTSVLTVGSGQISAPGGLATAPSYTFNGDTNTGIFSTYSDGLEFATGGTRRMFIDNGAIGSTNTSFAGPSGTASNPGFRFFLDGDNGMFNPTSNMLGFSTAGTERIRINDVGDIGIGTSTPSARLDVWGNLRVGTSSVPALFVNTATGNVGIGTESPIVKLDVTGNIIARGGGATISSDTFANFSNAGNLNINYQLGTFSVSRGLTTSLRIDESGNVGIGTTTPVARLAVTAAPGTGDLLVLASSTNARALTVNFLGNIGIGTASPLSGIHTYGNLSGAVETLRTENASNGAAAHSIIRFINDGGVNGQAGFYFNSSNRVQDAGGNGFGFYNDATNGNLAFRTRGDIFFSTSFPTVTERLRITTGGNIGIGTSSPAARLAVTGLAGTGDVFSVASSTNASMFVVKSDGNVGLGTSTPAARLDVQGGGVLRVGGTALPSFPATGQGFEIAFDADGSHVGTGSGSGASIFQSYSRDSSAWRDIWFRGNNITFSANGTNVLTMLASANVGIGTTTPSTALTLGSGQITVPTGTAAAPTYSFSADSNMGMYRVSSGLIGFSTFSSLQMTVGNGGVTITPSLILNTTGTAANATIRLTENGNGIFRPSANILAITTNATERLRVDSSGNVGIGTTTPTAQLHTTGTVRFSTFTAGTLTTDADGNVTASSDERLKDIEGDFSRGLEDLRRIQPITYKWRTSSGLDTDSSYSGFSAQNVQLAIPEAVASRPGGFLSLSDRPILATAINAIKELADKIDTITAWFRDGKFDVQNDVCVDDVCVTKDQFKTILRNAGGSHGVETDQSGGGSDTDGGTQDQSGDVPAGDPDPEPTDGGEEPAPTDNQTEADGGGATDSSGEGQNEPAGDSQTDSTSSDGGSNSDSGGSEGDSSGGEGASV